MRTLRRLWPLLLPLLAAAALAATQMMSVQVRQGQLRDKPSFLGKIAGAVAYGDQVTVMESRDGWTRVQGAAGSGWIHTSALSPKKIVLKSGAADVNSGASGQELALAGKGFNDEVEAEFKTGHPQADFTWVDRMEQMKVDPDQAAVFLQTGGVVPAAGGAR